MFLGYEVIRHLKKLFNKTHIPTPLMTSIRIWNGTLEFPVATHSWGLGADDKTIIEQMVSPFHNIYIANETYSDQQTWVNGSLRSTDLVLAKGFGISKLSSKETKSV